MSDTMMGTLWSPAGVYAEACREVAMERGEVGTDKAQHTLTAGTGLPEVPATQTRHKHKIHSEAHRDTHRHTCSYGGAHHTPGVYRGPSEHRDSYKCHSYPHKPKHPTRHVCKHASEKPLQINTCTIPATKTDCRAHTRPTIDNATQTQNTRTHTHAGTKTHIQMLTTSDTQTHTLSVSHLGTFKDSCVCLGSPGLGHEYVQSVSEKWVKWGFLAYDLRVP